MNNVATSCITFDSMHGFRASLSAGGHGILIRMGLQSPLCPHHLNRSILRFRQPYLLPPTSLQAYRPSKSSESEPNSHCQSMMPPLHCNILILSAITLTLPLLTTSIPTTNTNQTTKIHPPALAHLPTSVLPHGLIADTCPTPPTEFLPYAPPPGYTPAPGCPPASEGTQPSENSGGGSSGSTSSAEVSKAGRLRATDALARVSLVILGWRVFEMGCGLGCPVLRWKA